MITKPPPKDRAPTFSAVQASAAEAAGIGRGGEQGPRLRAHRSHAAVVERQLDQPGGDDHEHEPGSGERGDERSREPVGRDARAPIGERPGPQRHGDVEAGTDSDGGDRGARPEPRAPRP